MRLTNMEYKNNLDIENKKFHRAFGVGFVVTNYSEKERLIVCSHVKRFSISHGKSLYLCSLMPAPLGYCPSNGQCFRFKHLYDGYHITWVCPKMDNPPNLER
jgi:hypothetical protein